MSELALSFRLALWTTCLLLPFGLWLGRTLARSPSRTARWIEVLLLLPLVLPPTVIGYYLLVLLSPASPVGEIIARLPFGPLAFSFEGLVVASLVVNLPFAVQPLQLAWQALPREYIEAGRTSGLSPLSTFLRVELPLVWPSVAAAAALVFAHTLGEFGVVLMIGGNIEGETRTVSIAIYDAMQSFDTALAGRYSAILLILSLACLGVVRLAGARAVARTTLPPSTAST